MKKVSQVGLSAGPLIGGALTEYTTWRWCKFRPKIILSSFPSNTKATGFYINLPVGGLVAVMFAFVDIPEIVPKQKFAIAIRALPGQLDILGFALFASSAIQLLLALQYGGNQFTWNSSQIIGLFCGAGATFLVFLLWDHRQGEKAMIPFSMIRKQIVWSSSLSYGFLLSQVFCVSWYLPQYFQGVKNASPLMSGVDILPSILAHFCVATISGKISKFHYRYVADGCSSLILSPVERLGYYLPIILTSASLMAVGNGLLSTLSPHASPGKWIGYQILVGATRALGLQVVSPTVRIYPICGLISIQADYCYPARSSRPSNSCCNCTDYVQSTLHRGAFPELLRYHIHQQSLITHSKIRALCGPEDNHQCRCYWIPVLRLWEGTSRGNCSLFRKR